MVGGCTWISGLRRTPQIRIVVNRRAVDWSDISVVVIVRFEQIQRALDALQLFKLVGQLLLDLSQIETASQRSCRSDLRKGIQFFITLCHFPLIAGSDIVVSRRWICWTTP